jgi:hypothetical protein
MFLDSLSGEPFLCIKGSGRNDANERDRFLFVFTTVVAALHCLGTRSAPAKAVEPGPAMSIP